MSRRHPSNGYTARVAATTNFQVIGIGRNERAKIEEAITRAIGSRPGRWHVQFIGSLGEDVWEMRVSGPATETAEYLDRTLGQHTPDYIADLLSRLTT
jgi:hypothetical protein